MSDGLRFRLDLADDARVDVLVFSMEDARLVFSHVYRRRNEAGEVDVHNKTTLVADYVDGALSGNVVLSMHVVLPERLGRRFVAGCDVSPGAKTYLEFVYEPDEGGGRRLAEIGMGASRRWRIADADPAALVRPASFPFPVPDRVEPSLGRLDFPFLSSGDGDADDETRYFMVPMSLRGGPPWLDAAWRGAPDGGSAARRNDGA